MLASRVLLARPRALSPAWAGLEVKAPPLWHSVYIPWGELQMVPGLT